uniref:Uncharacterized protein n=1 Tax=Heterorhabditis bacteriophora TaxID=37862 RepID=A0A1I7XUA9_HETBA
MNEGIIIFTFLIVFIHSRADEGNASVRKPEPNPVRAFDLPKYAPRARIIQLSTHLTEKERKHHRGREDELLRDKAGSFDNFEAFNFGESQEEGDGTELKGDMNVRKQEESRERKSDENLGDFFPENK